MRRLLRLTLPLLALPLLAWLAFEAAVAWWPYPPGLDAGRKPATWIEDRHGTPLAALAAEDGRWHLPLQHDQVSPHLLRAIVAAEDARFEEHYGVDWRAAGAAAWLDLKSLGIRRGASTLTMQLHRLRDPRPRNWSAKIEQAVRARQIERRTTKDQILLEYLNRAPFGGNLVGAGAASWRYFGQSCKDLSLGRSALLAGLPQNPERLRPDRYPDRAARRRDYVLGRMLAVGMITRAQYDEAIAEPIDARWRPLPQNAGEDATSPGGGDPLPPADGAMPTLTWLARRHPGQVVRTTLDAAVQHQAAVAAMEQLRQLQASGVTAAAVIVLDTPTARCLAAVSLSTNALGPAVPIATPADHVDLVRSPRSTGSTLKPFIYAAAFDAGIATPSTILHDTPSAWAGYVPGNFDHAFRGDLSAAEALAESRNIPALQLLSQVGVDRAAAVMGQLGLTRLASRPHRYGLSLAVGGAEASPLELAEAYATLARGGVPKPATFTADEAPPGPPQPDLTNTPGRPGPDSVVSRNSNALLSPGACRQVLAALSDRSRTEPLCLEAARLHVAWKTGTSSGRRDAWCAAVTPSHTVVVWLGNPSGKGAAPLVGVEAAAPPALKLIAALAAQDGPAPPAPWTAEAIVRETSPRGATPTVAARPVRRLTLLSPSDGLEIVYNTDLPPDRQKVLLRALPADPNGANNRLWWFVDDARLGETQGDAPLFWPPASGPHEVRVVDAAGHAASARVQVR